MIIRLMNLIISTLLIQKKLEAGINNLNPGISYKVRGTVVLGGSDFIPGEWRHFTTLYDISVWLIKKSEAI